MSKLILAAFKMTDLSNSLRKSEDCTKPGNTEAGILSAK